MQRCCQGPLGGARLLAVSAVKCRIRIERGRVENSHRAAGLSEKVRSLGLVPESWPPLPGN